MEKFINLRNLAFVLFLNSTNFINAQNVGIGTTNPLSKLHINGQLRVDTFLAGSSNDSIVTIDATGVFRRRNANAISGQNIYNTNGVLTNNRNVFMGSMTLAFDTTTLFLNPNTNRVGIGTTSPTDLLDVNGSARIRTMPNAVNSDNLVYTDANGVLKRGSQSGKLLNYVAIDDPAMSNTSFSSTTLTDLISYNYTPVSNNSKIIVEYQNQNYTMSGGFSSTAVDDWEAWLQVGAFYPTVNYWRASINSSDIYRSSNLLPIKGVHTNNSTNTVTIKVQIKRVSSDDSITFRQGNGGWNGSLIIQEIGN